MVVPSSEQKQSGRTQTAGSHGGALFGSLSMSGKSWEFYKIIKAVRMIELKKIDTKRNSIRTFGQIIIVHPFLLQTPLLGL